jgi:hypothetical protein
MVEGFTNPPNSPLFAWARNNSMYSTSHASCSEGSEQLGLAARRPQPSCLLVLEINASGVVRLLTFLEIGQ